MPDLVPPVEDNARRERLRIAVVSELQRLERHSPHNAPLIGGWSSRAIENVARTEGMNPYTLDHIIRVIL